ncbi:hypothetical protein H257_01885 [Aphanomyces astaci]|uniref:Uncharacterized protein n=1 Tax=Aphanomyces astaci TaxID=112090 RepID=W4H5E6_APHAT|nr:hypothetical protein H257_01885 [Aphanomyces astaci]ETV86821.1 hypothetical protein H257_01885 [Aphanomyces astaci]|eukprot:XP_009823620.1 hypothetical protein H257_01885 [Aphanomyces astaci]
MSIIHRYRKECSFVRMVTSLRSHHSAFCAKRHPAVGPARRAPAQRAGQSVKMGAYDGGNHARLGGSSMGVEAERPRPTLSLKNHGALVVGVPAEDTLLLYCNDLRLADDRSTKRLWEGGSTDGSSPTVSNLSWMVWADTFTGGSGYAFQLLFEGAREGQYL